ncbi:Uncharacterised protein [Serratia plymuthica]|uniref:Uncharacterized protein n=1 Tax=Serratia plymuthica TaxID=82996 RepID=A0A2X4WYB3_SERPL|nr:Uncharacterised protein [Serratia plymuthica]
MDVHVAERRQQQLTLRLITRHARDRRRIRRMDGGDVAVFDFQLVERGAGADHRIAIVFETLLQPYVAQHVVMVGQGHGFGLRRTVAASLRCGLRHAAGQPDHRTGGGELASLAEESSAALLLGFFHVQFLNPEVRCVKKHPPI